MKVRAGVRRVRRGLRGGGGVGWWGVAEENKGSVVSRVGLFLGGCVEGLRMNRDVDLNDG